MRLAGSHVITLLDLARVPSAKVDTISGRKHPFGHGKSCAWADVTIFRWHCAHKLTPIYARNRLQDLLFVLSGHPVLPPEVNRQVPCHALLTTISVTYRLSTEGVRHAALQLLSRALTAGVSRHQLEDGRQELEVGHKVSQTPI